MIANVFAAAAAAVCIARMAFYVRRELHVRRVMRRILEGDNR
jgi:hypothetical protein